MSNIRVNFRHISLRLTVLWGLVVLIHYGVLLPLRGNMTTRLVDLTEQRLCVTKQLVQSSVNKHSL